MCTIVCTYTYRCEQPIDCHRSDQRKGSEEIRWETRSNAVENTSRHVLHARDHMIVSRFSLNLRHSGRRTTPTTFASRKAFSREAVLLFNGSTLKSELLYNRQLGQHDGGSKSPLDRKLRTRLARRRARINKFHVRFSYFLSRFSGRLSTRYSK